MICEEWLKRGSRINVIDKDNRGLASVRNLGLSLAEGDYIAWVDGNDYSAPVFLLHMYTTLQEKRASMVMCGFYTDVDGTITSNSKELFLMQNIPDRSFLE